MKARQQKKPGKQMKKQKKSPFAFLQGTAGEHMQKHMEEAL